jgi:rhodanese-related sulfurtransferase
MNKLNQMNIMKRILTAVAVAAFAISALAAEFPDVSVKEVKALAAFKKAVIIDVNGTESYEKGRVPGALNYEAVKGNLASALPADKNTPIVAYCGNPKCKAYKEAAEAAAKLGYTNVKHMSAGIQGWKDAGEKTEKG